MNLVTSASEADYPVRMVAMLKMSFWYHQGLLEMLLDEVPAIPHKRQMKL